MQKLRMQPAKGVISTLRVSHEENVRRLQKILQRDFSDTFTLPFRDKSTKKKKKQDIFRR